LKPNFAEDYEIALGEALNVGATATCWNISPPFHAAAHDCMTFPPLDGADWFSTIRLFSKIGSVRSDDARRLAEDSSGSLAGRGILWGSKNSRSRYEEQRSLTAYLRLPRKVIMFQYIKACDPQRRL
jgi:hypothetical protein